MKVYLISLIGVFLPLSDISAKEYSIPEIQVDVQINADGTITITEHRTYVYDGSYTWANYRLPKSGYSAIRDISVSENGESYTNLNTEEPGTFWWKNRTRHTISYGIIVQMMKPVPTALPTPLKML